MSRVAAPADRRFRRPDVLPERRRRFGRGVVRSMRWALAGAVLVLGGLWMAREARRSPLLAVERVAVSGNAHLSAAEVQQLVAGMRGQNIFSVDFDEYRRKVLDSPWVADVALWRILPSTIQVRITERTPLAIARLGEQLYLVDDAGVIIDQYGAQYRDLDLPIVDGLVASEPVAGTPVDADRVQLASALLASLGAHQELRRHVSQIDVSSAHDAMVMFDNDTSWLHLGDAQFAERLTNYLELAPTLRDRFHDIDYVDLRFGDRVYVRSRTPGGRAGKPGK